MKMLETSEDMGVDIIIRPIQCELNLLTRSDGSALLTQGETAIMASVSGPIEVKLQNLYIDKSSIEVSYRPKSGHSGVGDRLKEHIIRNTCEAALLGTLYPRTAILIQLQEMEDKAGLIACAINASCLALLNSAIAMKYVVAAVHAVIDKNGELIIDPDYRQCKDCRASLTFVFDSINKNLITIHTFGKFTKNNYNEALTVCRGASTKIFEFYNSIVKKFSKIL